MQKEETVPKALRWMENDLGSIARYIWLNVKDKFQREIHLRALLGDAYAQIHHEIENDIPCSVQDVSIREMSESAYGREFYNSQLFLLKNVEKVLKKQQIQEERAERAEQAMSLLMEGLKDLEQAISKIQSTVENTASEQSKLSDEFKENQAEIRQKTDAITEKLETDSQAVAELKAFTISAEKEQKSFAAEVMRIQESLNGIIQSTNEMKRKQDFYAMQVWENARKFENFIGQWKLVKGEENGVEGNISDWDVQSHSFEPVPEGVLWKRYKEDGSEYDSAILTTDEEIENKLYKEGKNCDLVEFQTDGSLELEWGWTLNVEGYNIIERWSGDVFTYEKC